MRFFCNFGDYSKFVRCLFANSESLFLSIIFFNFSDFQRNISSDRMGDIKQFRIIFLCVWRIIFFNVSDFRRKLFPVIEWEILNNLELFFCVFDESEYNFENFLCRIGDYSELLWRSTCRLLIWKGFISIVGIDNCSLSVFIEIIMVVEKKNSLEIGIFLKLLEIFLRIVFWKL